MYRNIQEQKLIIMNWNLILEFRRFSIVGLFFLPKLCFSENFDELLSAARQNDNIYRSVKYQYQSTLTHVDQARAAFFPTFSLTANTNLNNQEIKYEGVDTPERHQQFDTYGYSLQLNQPLFRYQNLIQYEQAEAQVVQAQAQMEQAELDLVVRMAQAYFESLQAKASLDTTEQNLEFAQAQSKDAQLKFTHQSTTLAEKLEAESHVKISLAERLEALSELNNKLFALRQITGLNLTIEQLSIEEVIVPDDMQLIEFWLQLAETQNPNVLLQEATKTVAQHEIEKAKSGHYPTLDLVGSYGNSKQGPSAALSSATMVNSGSIGVQVNMPIFAGGAVSYKVDEAVLLLQKSHEDLEAARKQAKNQAYQSYNSVISSKTQYAAYEQAVNAYQQSLKAMMLGYQLGNTTLTEVFKIRQQLSTAQREKAKSKANISLNYIKLRVAIGDLNFSNW